MQLQQQDICLLSRAAELQWSPELCGVAAKHNLTRGAVLASGVVCAVQMQERISGLIRQAAEMHEQLKQERTAASAHLDRLASISAGVDCAKRQPLPQLPEVRAPCLASQRSSGQVQHMSDEKLEGIPLETSGSVVQ